jgi:hypothetical protein
MYGRQTGRRTAAKRRWRGCRRRRRSAPPARCAAPPAAPTEPVVDGASGIGHGDAAVTVVSGPRTPAAPTPTSRFPADGARATAVSQPGSPSDPPRSAGPATSPRPVAASAGASLPSASAEAGAASLSRGANWPRGQRAAAAGGGTESPAYRLAVGILY